MNIKHLDNDLRCGHLHNRLNVTLKQLMIIIRLCIRLGLNQRRLNEKRIMSPVPSTTRPQMQDRF